MWTQGCWFQHATKRINTIQLLWVHSGVAVGGMDAFRWGRMPCGAILSDTLSFTWDWAACSHLQVNLLHLRNKKASFDEPLFQNIKSCVTQQNCFCLDPPLTDFGDWKWVRLWDTPGREANYPLFPGSIRMEPECVRICSNVCSSDSAQFVEVSMVIMVCHHVKRADRPVDALIWHGSLGARPDCDMYVSEWGRGTESTRKPQEMEGKRRSAGRRISRSDGKTKGLIQTSRQASGGIWICYSCTFPTWVKLLCCAFLCLQCETLRKHWPVPLAFISTKKGIKQGVHTVNILFFSCRGGGGTQWDELMMSWSHC